MNLRELFKEVFLPSFFKPLSFLLLPPLPSHPIPTPSPLRSVPEDRPPSTQPLLSHQFWDTLLSLRKSVRTSTTLTKNYLCLKDKSLFLEFQGNLRGRPAASTTTPPPKPQTRPHAPPTLLLQGEKKNRGKRGVIALAGKVCQKQGQPERGESRGRLGEPTTSKGEEIDRGESSVEVLLKFPPNRCVEHSLHGYAGGEQLLHYRILKEIAMKLQKGNRATGAGINAS